MRFSRNIATALALFLCVTLLTGCPTAKQLDRMAGASRELAHDTVTAEKTVAALYKANALSLAQKDRLAEKLKLIATNGQRFNALIASLDQQYRDGKLSDDALSALRKNFLEVSRPFADLLSDFNLLPSWIAKRLNTGVQDLQRHVETIQETLNR
ncbi:MAG TPA: hypothetical protein VF723_11315 [Pyrinomonadaceae bacterium]|jgi:outer membrane murein-binding lipoprotein Lpp